MPKRFRARAGEPSRGLESQHDQASFSRGRSDAPVTPGPYTDRDLLRAVTGHDANAQLPVVLRTRRAIRIADDSRREQGERGRRHIGITLLVLGAIFVVLAPAIWDSVDDFIGGEHFGDLPTQVMMLSTFLMLAIVGALAAIWRNRADQDEYSQDL